MTWCPDCASWHEETEDCRLERLATDLFGGDVVRARSWLRAPASRTAAGRQQVVDLIGRLEHGVFT